MGIPAWKRDLGTNPSVTSLETGFGDESQCYQLGNGIWGRIPVETGFGNESQCYQLGNGIWRRVPVLPAWKRDLGTSPSVTSLETGFGANPSVTSLETGFGDESQCYQLGNGIRGRIPVLPAW